MTTGTTTERSEGGVEGGMERIWAAEGRYSEGMQGEALLFSGGEPTSYDNNICRAKPDQFPKGTHNNTNNHTRRMRNESFAEGDLSPENGDRREPLGPKDRTNNEHECF